MAASPNSSADRAGSDVSAPSSPVRHKSFNDAGDDGDETQIIDDTIIGDTTINEGSGKPSRSKGKSSSKDKDGAQSQIGKIRHLKKEDGEPLWREDIQHDFLKAIFENDQAVFTNSYDQEGLGKQCFADLYIDAMARSSKTSKVLRDKLLSDREAAKGMAMVCLLVNMGRMNTTLNFFPEMRAQLRTYHAIPSLQANQDPHAYKQLQDAPRLKSILKGGAEDREEPSSLGRIKEQQVPRTNPVNLIFVMCNNASKVAELHFPKNHEFHDLIMKTQYSSKTRAMAFLWLMWFYLESDFTEEGCEENPFGPGVDYGLDVANQGVPKLDEMDEECRKLENVDPPEEIEFGMEKQKMRAKILEMDQAYLNEREARRGKLKVPFDDGPAVLPRIRPSKHESDMDSTRSTPPPKGLTRGVNAGSSRRGAPLKYQIFEGSSPARHASEGVMARKPRPPTAHQLAVERNRHERVEYILENGLEKQHHKSRKLRKQEGVVFRAWKRTQSQDDPLEDSDGEASSSRTPESTKKLFRERGLGGLALLASEDDNFGEEAQTYNSALRRANRRLSRWEGRDESLGPVPPTKKLKVKEEEPEITKGSLSDKANNESSADAVIGGDVTMEVEYADQTAMADDEGRPDEDMDDPDKTDAVYFDDTDME